MCLDQQQAVKGNKALRFAVGWAPADIGEGRCRLERERGCGVGRLNPSRQGLWRHDKRGGVADDRRVDILMMVAITGIAGGRGLIFGRLIFVVRRVAGTPAWVGGRLGALGQGVTRRIGPCVGAAAQHRAEQCHPAREH